MPTRRHWTINGRFLSQPVTGVQRYAHEILQALDQTLAAGHPLADNLAVDLVVPPDAADLPSLQAIEVRPAGRVRGHVWEQTVLPRHARGGLVSLCNTGPAFVRKHIVCIHDLNTRSYPGSYSFRFRALYRVLLPLLGQSVARIATVSSHSADDLVRYRICSRNKIVLTPNGHEHVDRWNPQHSESTSRAAGRSTIVIVGSLAPHKNIALITGLAGRFRDVGLRIAVVGIADGQVFKTQPLFSEANNIVWLGRLSDNELAALLRDSMCLALPSFVEGFGLPALEAMAAGCPVVVSDRSCLPEICGEAALYASPTEASAWFDQFLRLHANEALRIALIEKGRKRARAFSWRKSAESYLRTMAALDGIRSTRETGKAVALSTSVSSHVR